MRARTSLGTRLIRGILTVKVASERSGLHGKRSQISLAHYQTMVKTNEIAGFSI